MPPADDAPVLDERTAAILEILAAAPGVSVSLPRLAKSLGLGVSTVMRHLRAIDGSTLGGHSGPAWVAVAQHDGRWSCSLSSVGRARLARHAGASLELRGGAADTDV